MAGYLTKAMILIRMEQQLRDQQNALASKRDQGNELNALEAKMLEILPIVRSYLSPEPAPSGKSFPLTDIEDPQGDDTKKGKGHGMSKYAFSGTLGTDFPAAGYVLSLHQRWVHRVVKRGAPRTAWVDAGSLRFAFELIDGINAKFAQPERKRAYMSYVLGHLASIATDVIIQPFLNHQGWKDGADTDGSKRLALSLALDAKIAKGFFQREDLQTGQSWTDYYVDAGDYEEEIQRLLELYFDAFQRVYGGPDPSEPLCGASADPCVFAKLDKDFLVDGYRNTVNWAIDVGYDQSPWLPRMLWIIGIIGGGLYLVYDVWSSTESFDTLGNSLFGWAANDVEDMRNEIFDAWQNKGLGSSYLWLQMLESSYFVSSSLFMGYSFLLTGIPVVWSEGLFAQGTHSSTGTTVYKITKFVLSLSNFVFSQIFPKEVKSPVVRWLVLGIMSVGLDLFDFLYTNTRSEENGEEGAIVDEALYLPKAVLALTLFVSSTFVFFRKHLDDDTSLFAVDFALGFLFPFTLACVVSGNGWYDSVLVEKITGAPWPDGSTDKIDSFLKIDTSGDRPALKKRGGVAAPIRYFPQPALITQEGKPRFPHATGEVAYGERSQKDEEVRVQASQPSEQTYNLDHLLDRAANLAGLLAISAIEYDTTPDVAAKEQARAVFDSWNLDFRTQEEWEFLMGKENESGLLDDSEMWLKALLTPVVEPQQ